MTHLYIELSISNTETVSSDIIKKLYDAAVSVSEPQLGEDNAYLSGHLEVGYTYESYVKYLAKTVFLKGSGVADNNPNGRFADLRIDVTGDYYIPFVDSAVETAVKAALGLSSGNGVTETQAANAVFTNSSFKDNTNITRFPEFNKFTEANTNPPNSLFEGCTNLSEVNLSSVKKISGYEFKICGIEDLNAPYLLVIAGNQAFLGSALKTIRNLGTIESIPNQTFSWCGNLLSIVFPTSVKTIGNEAFAFYGSYNGLYTTKQYDTVTVTGLNNVTTIGKGSFRNCSNFQISASELTSLLTIDNHGFDSCSKLYGELNCPNLTSIATNAFRQTNINKVKCLGKVNNIPEECFAKNQNGTLTQVLTEVYIPYECINIGNSAFRYNLSLTTIKQYTDSVDNWIEGTTPTYGDISRVTIIGPYAFDRCSSLMFGDLSLPYLTDINYSAFRYCTNITSISNLGYITNLPSYYSNDGVFYGCTGLLTATLPESLTSIGYSTFNACSNLRWVKILANSVPNYSNVEHGTTYDYGKSFGEWYLDDDVTKTYIGHTYPIYVKDVLLSSYLTDSVWSKVGPNRLRPLSQFATDFPNG